MKRTIWLITAIGSFLIGWLSNGYGQFGRPGQPARTAAIPKSEPVHAAALASDVGGLSYVAGFMCQGALVARPKRRAAARQHDPRPAAQSQKPARNVSRAPQDRRMSLTVSNVYPRSSNSGTASRTASMVAPISGFTARSRPS